MLTAHLVQRIARVCQRQGRKLYSFLLAFCLGFVRPFRIVAYLDFICRYIYNVCFCWHFVRGLLEPRP
jgi:hypothetical protein